MSTKQEKEKEASPLLAGGASGNSSSAPDATDIVINVSPSSKPAVIASAKEDEDVPHEKTCRICMEPETKKEDPLISPCLCKGSTRYIHRACLAKWRATKVGTQAHYRCEICHFEYVYRRIWWARLLRARPVAFAIFMTTLVLVATLVGFIRYPWSNPAAYGAGGNFVLNVLAGLGVLGVLGLLGFVYCVCSGRATDGEGAIVIMIFVLIYTGLAYLCYALFGIFYKFVRSRLEHASYMVENIGEDGAGANGWRDWLFGKPVKSARSSNIGGAGDGAGTSANGGGGGGGGGGGPAGGDGKGASNVGDSSSGGKKWGPPEADCSKAPAKETMA
ncbi:hypothetical protein HXX76_000192 [Chlamydomonas incerta]|uniref:RING-CH-type domain-containing protein n=1 Tax=Chlamydomonas incerta TaxID=51695 RepID=A0A836B297_CHLIN|nr:hypothetical protein HXX76_000192 [Chlamydomonas incerta]|eukprot:KAG2445580.1 hypothetical protein HXX76_000192 [Chlamydomonas incerta]